MKTPIEIIEDFSGGQFYILDDDVNADPVYLQSLYAAALEANNQPESLTTWGKYVADRLCREIPAAIQRGNKAPGQRSRNPVNKPGFVYLIKSPSGHYKIGRTTNPENRMKTFTVKLPFEVEYLCVIPTTNMYALESRLHKYFAEKRVNGEWFSLAPEDIEYIKGVSE